MSVLMKIIYEEYCGHYCMVVTRSVLFLLHDCTVVELGIKFSKSRCHMQCKASPTFQTDMDIFKNVLTRCLLLI